MSGIKIDVFTSNARLDEANRQMGTKARTVKRRCMSQAAAVRVIPQTLMRA